MSQTTLDQTMNEHSNMHHSEQPIQAQDFRLQGVVCPSITISKDDGTLDYEAWGKHLDHLIDAGINGILIFGSIGEFYAYSLATKKEAVRFAINHVRHRVPVLVGVGHTNLDEVLDFTHFAQDAGADAIVAVSPYYFGPSCVTAKRYFGAIANACDLPIILYNFPARTGSDLTPELVAELAQTYPTIVGIKDTVDTISHTRMMIEATRKVNPHFIVFSGFDEYYTVNRIAGGNGVISGLTNVEPETFAALHSAYESGDFTALITAAQRISHLMAVYGTTDLFIAAIKAAVNIKGLPISTLIREPAHQITAEQESAIRTILQ